ncbi:MAG: AarF/ABC1/UbiB kinase family protein [Nitrospirae bacterium]|nr:AarF/ABC1/UbiB kinase family protein [Nitrospirota bacterium]
MAALDFFRIGHAYRNIGRLRHIVNVFLKHGFGQFLERLNLRRFVPFRRRIRLLRMGRGEAPYCPLPEERTTLAERIRLAFEELGPTFIKFGQILSVRPDLIPRPFIEEFSKLQDEVPPFPVQEVRAILEADWKRPIDQVLASFDEVPVAAASIAQVHRAKLLSGEDVVLKIRRPHIETLVAQDVEILRRIAELIDRRIPEMRIFNLTMIVDEFARCIRKEMDFVLEGENAARFKLHFDKSPDAYVPAVFRDLSTPRVLVLERIAGIRINDVRRLEKAGFDLADVARQGVEVAYKMVLEDGFFHADPHPGNLFVLPDGRIGIVDFGIVGRVSEDQRRLFADTFVAFVRKDFGRLVEAYVEMGIVSPDTDLHMFRREFKRDLEELIEPIFGRRFRQIPLAEYAQRGVDLAVKYKLQLPRDLYLLNKTMVTIEGLALELAPDLDLYGLARPFAERLVKKYYSASGMARDAGEEILKIASLVRNAPKRADDMVEKVLKDDLHLNLSHKGLDRFTQEFDRSSNRLSFALIIASIVVGSSIIVLSAKDVTHGYPLLALVGYGAAVTLGLWLVIAIMRSGRL